MWDLRSLCDCEFFKKFSLRSIALIMLVYLGNSNKFGVDTCKFSKHYPKGSGYSSNDVKKYHIPI